MAVTRAAFLILLGLGALVLPSCGAGLITGAVASDNGRDPASPPPGLSPPERRFPLVPGESASAAFRTVVVANAAVPSGAALRVELRAAGAVAVQGSPAILSGQGAQTVVGFLLRTEAILLAIGDPTAADVPAELAVLVDGREVAPPVPVELLAQPTARLVLPAPGGAVFLSPLGGTEVTLRCRNLRAVAAAELQVQISTADPAGGGDVTRPCTGVTLAGPIDGEFTVTARAPGNTFPGAATFQVIDLTAGRSTLATSAFFRPEVQLALPGQGPTTGGSLVTLIGRALVPLDFSVQPARKAFESVRLLLRKGGREQALPDQDLRPQESDLDRLVFTMPMSPDGRPGQVDIVLRVDLGTVQAEVVERDVFNFSNPQPVFGPRGAVLDRVPVASSLIALERAPGGDDAPDFAMLYAEAGVGFLQLLMAEENGMFTRFGAARRIGDPAVPGERDPRSVCVADFDGDGVPDILAVNGGSGSGVQHLIHGQSAPQSPLGAVSRLPSTGGLGRCAAADLDGDGVEDLVLVPGAGAPPGALPQVWLARPTAGGFVRMADLPVRERAYAALTVADLDGDGRLDVALGTGDAAPGIDVAYGRGDGTFDAGQALDLTIPNYPVAGSPLVGLHAVGEAAPLPLAMMLAGVPDPVSTPPALAVLRAIGARQYDQLVGSDVLTQPGIGTFRTSLAADLDDDGVVELVVALDSVTFPLVLFAWNGSAFGIIPNGVERGSETMQGIRSLHFGTAFPPDPQAGRGIVRAVFAVHDSDVDGVLERRVSTLLVAPGPSLLAPDLGGQVTLPLRGLVGGSFTQTSLRSGGSTRDIALATTGNGGQIRLLTNDGAGGFFGQGGILGQPGIVPETLTLARATPEPQGADSLVVLANVEQGGTVTAVTLNLWTPLPAPGLLRSSPDLRAHSPNAALRTARASARSRIANVDVDGDGILDLVVLLTFDLPQQQEGDGLLLLLRGKPAYGPGEFPFHDPAGVAAVATVHGNATGMTVADFVLEGQGQPRRLEVAVAVPAGTSTHSGDGDHVRFYRHRPGATPAADALERSFGQGGPDALLAGDAPTRLAAADFDNNGTIDLLVAAAGDSTLRLFLNSGQPASDPSAVNVAAFRESLTSPRPVAAGRVTSLRLGDVNGDGNVDALVASESGGAELSSAVAFYLSDGTGSLANPVFVSPTRLGNRDGSLVIDLGDFNGDGQIDLAAAWSTPGNRNVRVLFGGSR